MCVCVCAPACSHPSVRQIGFTATPGAAREAPRARSMDQHVVIDASTACLHGAKNVAQCVFPRNRIKIKPTFFVALRLGFPVSSFYRNRNLTARLA